MSFLTIRHHRLKICRKYKKKYAVREVKLASHEEAEKWICGNQLARCNLPPEASNYYRGQLYDLEKQEHGGQIPGSSGHNDHSIREKAKTAQIMAKVEGVSESTIRRNAAFARAVDFLEEITPGSRQEILAGSMTQKAVMRKAKHALPKNKKPKPAPAQPARPARSRPTIEPDSFTGLGFGVDQRYSSQHTIWLCVVVSRAKKICSLWPPYAKAGIPVVRFIRAKEDSYETLHSLIHTPTHLTSLFLLCTHALLRRYGQD